MKKWKIVLILACSFALSGCTKTPKSTENIDQGNVSLGKGYYEEALGSFQTALIRRKIWRRLIAERESPIWEWEIMQKQ